MLRVATGRIYAVRAGDADAAHEQQQHLDVTVTYRSRDRGKSLATTHLGKPITDDVSCSETICTGQWQFDAASRQLTQLQL